MSMHVNEGIMFRKEEERAFRLHLLDQDILPDIIHPYIHPPCHPTIEGYCLQKTDIREGKSGQLSIKIWIWLKLWKNPQKEHPLHFRALS